MLHRLRDVERREEHQALAVDGVLDLARRGEQLAEQLGVADRAEHGDLVHVEAVRARVPWRGSRARGPRPWSPAACRASSIARSSMKLPVSATPAVMCSLPLLGQPASRAVRRRRYLEAELGPLAVLGLGADAPLVQLDDAPGVVEADAGAAARLEGRVVEAREAPEQLVLLGRAEARPSFQTETLSLAGGRRPA